MDTIAATDQIQAATKVQIDFGFDLQHPVVVGLPVIDQSQTTYFGSLARAIEALGRGVAKSVADVPIRINNGTLALLIKVPHEHIVSDNDKGTLTFHCAYIDVRNETVPQQREQGPFTILLCVDGTGRTLIEVTRS